MIYVVNISRGPMDGIAHCDAESLDDAKFKFSHAPELIGCKIDFRTVRRNKSKRYKKAKKGLP